MKEARSPIPQDLPLSLRALGEQELTPWFPARVKPARIGYYIREYALDDNKGSRDLWDGKKWWLCNNSDGEVIGEALSPLRWRGLAKEPKP